MRVPLDTRILLWAVSTPERLDEAAREAILSADNDVLFSAASIWETRSKPGCAEPILSLGRASWRGRRWR